MAAFDPEALAQVRAAAKEAGASTGFEEPEGVHHVVVTKDTKADRSDNGLPYLRVAFEIVCGEHKGRKISEFGRWFASEDSQSSKSIEDRTKTTRGMFKGLLYGAMESNGSFMADVAEAATGLSEDPDEVQLQMAEIGEMLVGVDGYLRVAKRTKGDGYNHRFIAADKPEATCECRLEGVKV